MGQKINPFIFRAVLNRNWESFWFSEKKKFPENLIHDIRIREIIDFYFKDKFYSKIIIQKSLVCVNIFIYVENSKTLYSSINFPKITLDIEKIIKKNIFIDLLDIKKPGVNIELIFYKLKKKIEQRKSCKVLLKNIFNEFFYLGGVGLKILIKGRINGSTMARSQVIKQGKLPLQRISANLKYYSNFIKTIYGTVGVKIWSYMGNFLYK